MSTQTLERAIALLRLLAASDADGLRLVDLQHASGLTKPTIHRILHSLKGEQFVDQVAETRRYRLGSELAVLGWSAGRTVYDLRELAMEDMVAVASKTGDTSFLAIRSANDTVCIDRQTGAYPIKAFIVDVGTRRPVGVGASGLAVLAALDEEEAAQVLNSLKGQTSRYPHATRARIQEAAAAARRDGFALSDGMLVPSVRAVGVCITDGARRPIAAISVAAIQERMPTERLPELVKTLRMHANRIEQRIAAFESRGNGGSRRIVRSDMRVA